MLRHSTLFEERGIEERDGKDGMVFGDA